MLLTWQQTEFLLKGVYLGLLVTIALLQPKPDELSLIALFTISGLVLFLGKAAIQKLREGYRIRGRVLGFIVFLILENPGLVYAGLLMGMTVGAGWTFVWWRHGGDREAAELQAVNAWPILAGAILGGIFYGLRHVRQRLYRFWIGIAMVGVLFASAALLYHFHGSALHERQWDNIGLLLLLGIPGFYLLTFSGMVEESEIEIAAMCAALGIGLWAFLRHVGPAIGASVVLVPLIIFFFYTTRVLPGLRVFKHALRGMSYRQLGETRLALISLGRAMQLDPASPLARQQLWDIHRDLDFGELKNHPDLVPFLNFDFCLERVSQSLQSRPDPAELREVMKMLDLIADEQPSLAAVCAYWRTVGNLHQHTYDEAQRQLESILKLPQMHTDGRQAIHFAAWQLALYGHPEMARRVGNVLLPQPGHRMDAIAAAESQLALTPQDPTAWDMKRQLYSELTEREYWSLAQPDQPMQRFNYEYVEQLGLALLDDPTQWQRGCEYLRIAAHGQPHKTANLYIQIAQTHEKHGDAAGMWANYQKAMQVGRTVGVQNLQPADREALFSNVKRIGEQAIKTEQIDVALEAFKFYTLHESAGIETYRLLADLFEKKKETWLALHCTEHGLTYNSEDKDLKERKDRYYYSIMPDELRARWENVQKWFDVQYCRDKVSWLLEKWNGDFELLDWAAHLAALAHVAQPASISARLLKARIHRLKGEIPEAIAVLEDIRQNRPEKIPGGEEQTAWYFAHRLLGDLYLDDKPDQAIACLLEFRKSDEAGADTSYKLGRAYEALGDLVRAAACYQEVTAYERHPLYYEARDALDRVKRGAPA